MITGLFIAISGACLGAGVLLGRRQTLWLALTTLAAATALAATGRVLYAGESCDWRTAWMIGGQPIHLRLDGISAFFIALLAFVGGAAAIYSRDYWPDRQFPHTAPRNRRWWSALLLTMGIVILAANGLVFLIGWELFAICAYLLITLDRSVRPAREAGWLYLAASHTGTLCLFAFFALLAAKTGSWELGPMQDRADLAPLFWLALVGFAVKAGLFPLHIWLPSAHANAPSHVSAILSGVALKLGIYGVVRFSGWLPLPAGAGWVLMAVGAGSALLGIAFALAQTDMKRLLAYSSVENIGIIVMGLGAGLLGITNTDAAWGRLAMAGALLHVWNHGVFKCLLFFGAGSVLHATGTREMSKLGGLWRLMPWTASLFGLGSLAVCALPPMNGFVSEWLIYLGLFEAVNSRTIVAWAAIPAAIILAVTGAIALACFVKAGAMIFLGAPRAPAARRAHESGPWMRAPMVLTAATVMTMGLAPMLVWPAVDQAVATWHPAWRVAHGDSPLSMIAPFQVAVAVIGAIGISLLLAISRRGGHDRQPTWDCGYELPSARMQYTAGSFSAIVAGWFRWILQPVEELRRPRGYFPAQAYRAQTTPETVLDCVLQPAARLILVVSSVVRRLQHGRLQFYIAYVVAGLIALAAIAATGGNP